MPLFTRQGIRGSSTLEEVIDYVIRLERKLNHLLRHLDSQNIFEVGGWRVAHEQLASKDGDVGMSTEDDNGRDSIRLWAGAPRNSNPPWYVTHGGEMKSTSGLIGGWHITQSILSSNPGLYPRIELNPVSNVIDVFRTPTDGLQIMTDRNGIPVIYFTNSNGFALQGLSGNSFLITGLSGAIDISIGAGRNLNLSASTGYVQVPSWSSFRNSNTSRTLQQELDSKADKFNGRNAFITVVADVDTVTGDVDYVTLRFDNGILTNVTT